jgi:hypothetical protein
MWGIVPGGSFLTLAVKRGWNYLGLCPGLGKENSCSGFGLVQRGSGAVNGGGFSVLGEIFGEGDLGIPLPSGSDRHSTTQRLRVLPDDAWCGLGKNDSLRWGHLARGLRDLPQDASDRDLHGPPASKG